MDRHFAGGEMVRDLNQVLPIISIPSSFSPKSVSSSTRFIQLEQQEEDEDQDEEELVLV